MDSSSRKKKTKLSPTNQTCFKKSKMISNLSMRQQTLFKKAFELSTLCDIEVCVIYYDREGELKTWPEDKSKVRDIAERYSRLNDREKRKKSTNLSQFLSKKILDDNKFSVKVLEMERSLENRLQIFRDTLLRLHHPEKQSEPDQSRAVSSGGFSTDLLSPEEPNQQWIESLMSHKSNDACSSEQHLNQTGGFSTEISPSLINDPREQWTDSLMSFMSGDDYRLDQDLSQIGGFNTDLSQSLINDPHQQWTDSLMSFMSDDDDYRLDQDLSQIGGFNTDISQSLINDPHQQWTESLMNDVSSTEKDLSLNQQQSKFTFFLYNHDNGTFSQLGDSVSNVDQLTPPLPDNLTTDLLGAQGFGLRSSNNNIELPPLQMQTQTPLLQFNQFAMWNQTPSFEDAMMSSSYS